MTTKRSAKELVKRYLFLCVGLFIMAFGVSFSVKASLGTSPITSVPYVISLFTPLTVGNITIIMHCVLILIQIIILRKRYELIQLAQLLVAIVFGYMTDLAIYLMADIPCSGYLNQWIFCIIGIVLVAVGVSFQVTANVVTVAGEGVVLAVCKVAPIKFGHMKVIFDLTLVAIAVALSLKVLGQLQGVREGTVAAAVCVGLIAKQVNKPIEKVGRKILC